LETGGLHIRTLCADWRGTCFSSRLRTELILVIAYCLKNINDNVFLVLYVKSLRLTWCHGWLLEALHSYCLKNINDNVFLVLYVKSRLTWLALGPSLWTACSMQKEVLLITSSESRSCPTTEKVKRWWELDATEDIFLNSSLAI
jgi:hypothetical protein